MLHEPTVEKLKTLNLEALLVAWQGQQADPKIHELGFDERLGLLVEAEWLARENRRLKRALAEAKLKQAQACLEDVEYSAKDQIDRSLLRQLATCRWVADHQQILITGAAGTGKTYLGCALAQQACRRGSGRSTAGRRGSSTSSSSRTPTGPFPGCSRVTPGWTCW